MCGLAHQFEAAGLATTLVALVRDHAERMRPPRALWVPFELGRPLGEPGDSGLQTEVVLAALNLLERDCGPVLEDFETEAPGRHDDPEWSPPFALGGPLKNEELTARFSAEIATLASMHDEIVKGGARTTIGVSHLGIAGIGNYLVTMLRGQEPDNPRPDCDPRDVIRAVMEDLKTACNAAALQQPGRPSSRQLADWLWGDTATGAMLLALARKWRAGDQRALQIIGQFVTVPGSQAWRLE